jgi:hypothetical protein
MSREQFSCSKIATNRSIARTNLQFQQRQPLQNGCAALAVKALADPSLKARYADLGATPWPTSQAKIKASRDAEEVRLLPIMRAAGIKPE